CAGGSGDCRIVRPLGGYRARRRRVRGCLPPPRTTGPETGVTESGRSSPWDRTGAGSSTDLSVGADAVGPSLAFVKSAGRVLQILELFDELQREARVSEIAERLGFPQSSTSMLLKSLAQLGYLDYDPGSRTFLPSPRVALLGAWLDKGPVRDGSLVRMLEHL